VVGTDRKRVRRASATRVAAAHTPSRKTSKSYPRVLRIIGGRWRGRKLNVSDSEGLRPTPDRVRETLFNWLQPYIEGATCLDLFAGTGALCLEALSRGAASAILVEKAATVVQQLRQQVKLLDAAGARVIQADAMDFLQGEPHSLDIIFIDPPFKSSLIAECSALVESRGWIKPGGLVYIEAPSQMENLKLPATWELIRSKKAGQVGYHLARKNP